MGDGGADKAAKKAARAQMQMMNKAIAEQKAAYGEGVELLSPFSQAGIGGLESYLALLGQSGSDAQAQAIAGLEQMPGYQAQLGAGQNAILQNASATGGLRGGNVQQGLAEFGSGLFGQYYQNQLNQLGQLQTQGLNTQTNLANLRAGVAGNVSNQYNMMGQAQGQGILAQGAARQQGAGNIGSLIGGGLGAVFGGGAGGASIGSSIGGALGGVFGGK
jgi:hypothetical protein